MRLTIKVIPNAKQNIYKDENGAIKVYLTASPVDGRANDALVRFLAQHFAINKSRITIVQGMKSRVKVIDIDHSHA